MEGEVPAKKPQKIIPHYSMREPRKFEKGDFCPACQKAKVSGDREGNIFCTQSGCGFETTKKELSTNDYEQINFKLMVIINKGFLLYCVRNLSKP